MNNKIYTKPKQATDKTFEPVAWKGVIFDKEVNLKNGQSFTLKSGQLGMKKSDWTWVVNVNVELAPYKSKKWFVLNAIQKQGDKYVKTQIGLLNEKVSERSGNTYYNGKVEMDGMESFYVNLHKAPEGKKYSMFLSPAKSTPKDEVEDKPQEEAKEADKNYSEANEDYVF